LSGATAGTLVEGATPPKTTGPFETEINLALKEGTTLGFTNADKTRGSISVACVPSESAAFRDVKRGGIYLLAGGSFLLANDQANASDDPRQKGAFIRVTCDIHAPDRGGGTQKPK
jgi:hypothetical protein